MADRPIIFSAPMVRALLVGQKTQTRRLLKPQPEPWAESVEIAPYVSDSGRSTYGAAGHLIQRTLDDRRQHGCGRIPYAIGDRLWVKETWRPSISAADPWHVAVLYPHDGQVKHWNWSSDADFGDWTIPKAAEKGNVTPLFMPRWASRLTLTVTDVRVQRLQDCSEADAVAEGCKGFVSQDGEDGLSPQEEYRELWNSLHGPGAWESNPWVAAYTFDVTMGNIDE